MNITGLFVIPGIFAFLDFVLVVTKPNNFFEKIDETTTFLGLLKIGFIINLIYDFTNIIFPIIFGCFVERISSKKENKYNSKICVSFVYFLVILLNIMFCCVRYNTYFENENKVCCLEQYDLAIEKHIPQNSCICNEFHIIKYNFYGIENVLLITSKILYIILINLDYFQ